MLPRPSHFSQNRPFIPPSSVTPSPNRPFYPSPSHPQGPYAAFEHSRYHPNLPFMDPSDSRTFFSYTPNEVKHRRRTTSTQLKVLETVFKRDTKPNAVLRSQLAAQLDMTARGVQIWFQNRRAKEKSKAAKLATTAKGLETAFPPTSPDSSPSTAIADTTPSPSDGHELPADASFDTQPSPNEQVASEDTSEAQSVSTEEPSILPVPSPPRLQVVTDFPTQNLRSPVGLQQSQPSSAFPQPDPTIFARRPSLPANMFHPPGVYTNGSLLGDPFDPNARRMSIDMSLHRLPNNPYAPLARAKNGALCGPRLTGQSRLARPPLTRPGALYNMDMRRGSLDSRAMGYPSTHFSPQTSHFNLEFLTSGFNQPSCIVTRRPRAPVLAGPLPNPNYTFGDASKANSPSSADSERNSPDSFNFRSEDTEDDDNSARYSASSRFGSIASIATSESSVYFPSPTGCEHDPNDIYASRRGSSASVMGLMSQLHVSNPGNQVAPNEIAPNNTHFMQHETSANPDGVEATQMPQPEAATGGYGPRLPSTAQDGNTHTHAIASSVRPNVPISASSELTYALQPENQRDCHNPYPTPSVQEAIDTQALVQSSTSYYIHPQNHVSALEMNSGAPTFGYADKYPFGAECAHLNSTGQYSNYTPLGNGFPVNSHNSTSLQHRQMMHTASDHYGSYPQVNTNESSTLSHEVPNVDPYVSYA